MRARITALLAVLEENPDLVRFAVVAAPSAGGVVMERSRALLERLTEGLSEGAPQGRDYSEPTEVERGAMAGALAAVLAGKVEGGQERVAEAAPELVELVLAPFVGRRRAAAAAAKP